MHSGMVVRALSMLTVVCNAMYLYEAGQLSIVAAPPA